MKLKKTWILAGCLALSSVTGTLGAEDAARDDQSPARQSESAKDREAISANLLRAKSLIGKSVKNEEGKDIGTIQDIIVDSRQGRIAYAVLQFGGFLGFGEKQFAIPFRALKEDAARQNLILNVKKEKLEAARGFEKDKWPDMADEEWARETHKHYGYENYWDGDRIKNDDSIKKDDAINRDPRATDPKETPKTNVNPNLAPKTATDADKGDLSSRPQLDRDNFWVNRVSQMLGKPVKNNAGDDLGKIADFMVDMKHGRLVYAIVTDGGTLGIGENFTAVPLSAFKCEPEKKQFTLNFSKDALKPFSFKENAWPNMADMHWARQVHEGFKQQPYWSVYGFAGDELDAGWRKDSDYNKAFNPAVSQTIKGKVTAINEFSPAKDSAKGRVVVITDEAGRVFNVHLGPVSYLDRADAPLKLKVGDTITVLGSTGTFEGKETFQAREITNAAGKSTQLQDSQGRPAWERQQDDRKTPKSNEGRPDTTPNP